jgi:signal transduction histidine kinase/ActR/RegA family two-component response regulator
MKPVANRSGAAANDPDRLGRRGRLFGKYAAMFVAVMSVALAINGLSDIWFSYREQRALLIRIQHGEAEAAAEKITQFLKEIEGRLAWATQLPWSLRTVDEWQFDAVRLMRGLPAITEITQLDAKGREQFQVSRQAPDVVGSQTDYSNDPAFIGAMKNKVYFGPVYFVRESEPYMTIAVAGEGHDSGVICARVNLKFIWEVVSRIQVGKHGRAYVIDAKGRLIADPDISAVLRNTDLSHLAHVQAARESVSGDAIQYPYAYDIKGQRVLSAYAVVAPVNWLLFVELPIGEAYAPVYASVKRSGILLLALLALAALAGVLLAHRIVVPIRSLHKSAERIASGDLTQRISISTGDELEVLGEQFNEMAARLQDFYATLERKVEERTRELEVANQAKSRFLAAASHDLRQPLHALGLFVAQLQGRMAAAERKQLVGRIDAALSAMNELFNALLDISKLDAGVLTPNITSFPVGQLLKRVETTLAGAAREKGLSLRVIPNTTWVRSDFILLERIVLNLASNALRYTNKGRVLIGCRFRGDRLRIEVWDTGIGVPQDQQKNIFGEFYRLGDPSGERRAGLGLGLAIVDRLCRLLDHPIDVNSIVGKGSCFSVSVPRTAAPAEVKEPESAPVRALRAPSGKVVAVIDDDPLVLEGMGGLLRSWGYRVVTAENDNAALAGHIGSGAAPDLIISDYRLLNGKTGIEVITRLRAKLGVDVPAFLVSGDINPTLLHEARVNGFHMLHKPVKPMALRALVTQLLKKQADRDLIKGTERTH